MSCFGSLKNHLLRLAGMGCLLLLGQMTALAQGTDGSHAPGKGVLLLVSTGVGQAGIDNYVRGFYGVLRDQGVAFTDIHIEYLDLVKNPQPGYRQRLGDLLSEKYPGGRIGALVVIQPPAMDFLLTEGARIAPNRTVLVSQRSPSPNDSSAGRQIYVQSSSLDYAGTLQRALGLFPRTKQVYFLSGTSALEHERMADAQQQFVPWTGKLKFIYLDKLAFEEMESLLKSAPANSVIIAPGVNRDVRGTTFVPVESIIRIAKSANAPVFPLYNVSIGRGPIGGMVSILENEGQSMARSVIELLNRTQQSPGEFRVQTARSVSIFDWQQLERWGADVTSLPEDTQYLNRPPSLWGLYKAYVIAGMGVILVLSGLTASLTIQNQRRRRAELSLRASQERYQLLADNTSDVFWILNLKRKTWDYLSPSIERLTGYPVQELLDTSIEKILPEVASAQFLNSNAQRVADSLKRPSTAKSYTDSLEIKRRDGSSVWTESVTHYVTNDQGELVLMGVTRDVSQRVAAEKKIEQLAFYDTLTHLPNRKLLQDRIAHAILGLSRTQRTCAVLFVDLDHFKTINDTRGHEVGDLLLQQAAHRLTASVRSADTVARLGGDEFVVILADLDSNANTAVSEAGAVGENILAAFRQDFVLQGQEHRVTASIGITLLAHSGDTGDELLKRADLAMYRAKAAGRDMLQFFDPQMQATATARANLERAIRGALQAQEFELYFQPQVDSAGVTNGAEALVRWQRPGHGTVSPADFIPLAEETGQILPLGQWVIETACTQLVVWAAKPETASLSLAINISARQFYHPDFVKRLLAALAKTGAMATRLKLELTESLMLSDIEDTISKMLELKSHGLSFSLDDFGTGYSSLQYLKRLPLDQLKIDQSFVRDLLNDANDAAIVRTTIALAKSLGLAVIAEGVETTAQQVYLAEHGCNNYQGYLFARPMPIAEFHRFLAGS